MASELQIRRIRDLDDPGIRAMVARSDEYLESLYPPESNHAEPLDVLVGDGAAFFAAFIEEELVACGGVMLADDDVRYGEIKRVYVDESQRGKHLATAIMQHLEDYLVGIDITIARLEAGPKQPAAIGLYRKLGYVERGPFGSYKPDPLSVFMEKRL